MEPASVTVGQGEVKTAFCVFRVEFLKKIQLGEFETACVHF
jgi:hypothetical protein